MLNPTELKFELYDHYIDQDLQVTIDRDPTKWSTNDGQVLTGYAHTMMEALGILGHTDTMRYQKMVDECQIEPGKYTRDPGRPDETSHDQLVGISSGGAVNKLSYPNDIAEYGIKHVFIWNVDNNLTWGDWLGRMVFHMMFLLLNTGKFRYLPLLPILLLKHLITKSDSYTIILNYMEIENLSMKYRLYKLFRNFMIRKLGLVEETIRFCKGNEFHPLVGLAGHIEKSC